MNHIYRLIWNTALNCWMVASEHTKGRGKRATRTLAAASVLILSLPALAVEAISEEQEDGVRVELPAAQPWLPAPYPFATGMVGRAAGTLATHYQSAMVTDSNYQNASINGNNSIILGSRASLIGDSSVGYGNSVGVNGNMATAVGASSKVYGVGATALGAEAQATAADAIAVGRYANATTIDAIAIGYRASATSQYAVAFGRGSAAGAAYSVAVGGNAAAPAVQSVAIGGNSSINGNSSNAIAMGYGAKVEVNGAGSMAMGHQAVASGGSAVAIGARASVTTHGGVGGIAIGADAAAGAPGYSGSIAVGNAAKATFNGVALGAAAEATANGAIALGTGSIANVGNTVSVGNATTKRKIVNVADGALSATSTDAVTGKQLHKATQDVGTALATAIAAKNTADAVAARLNDTSTAIGRTASATGTNATAVGQSSTASGSHTQAFGTGAKAIGDNAVAVGTLASAVSYDAIALGDRAAVGTGSVGGMALGANAAVNANAGKAVALGANSVATELDAVSVGNTTLKRKIVNVADGTVSATSTDAVTGKQLHGVKVTADAVAGRLSAAQTALGKDAKAAGTNATAVGLGSNASGSHGTALGRSASATGEFSIAMGSGSQATMRSAVAVGEAAAASGNYSAALGYKASAAGGFSTAFGYESAAAGNSSVALGSLATSAAAHSIALGDRAQIDATANEGVALGHHASVAGGASGAVALGYGSVAADKNTVSVGNATMKRKIVNVDDGVLSAASTEAVTGRQLHATDQRVIAVDEKATAATRTADAATARLNNARFTAGESAIAAGVNANAIGYKAAATGSHSNAMGHEAFTGGANAVAIGTLASAGSDMAIAVGNHAAVNTTASGGLALGNYARVTAGATNAIALGAHSVASTDHTVSVGSASVKRRIVNVQEGDVTATSNDAVVGKQLHVTNQRVAGLGGLVSQTSSTSDVRLGADNTGTTLDVRNKSNAGRVITGLAEGAVDAGSTQAVTGKQLHQQQQLVSANAQRIDANLGRINSNQTAVGTNREGIAENRSGIDGNRDDIASLRNAFEDFAPDLEGVVMFNDDRTRVDMEGARVTGLMEGDISSGSKDAVTGGQLFVTNARVDSLEERQSYVQVGSDAESEPAHAGWLGVAIGDSAQASTDGAGGTAVGSFAKALATNSVALGRGATVTTASESGFALGSLSRVDAIGGLAIGGGAVVASGSQNGVALGHESVTSEANTVSVGNDRLKRRISNVANGRLGNDAVTVEQLQGVLAGLGGGATVGASGEIVGPTYTLRSGGVYNDVGAALAALDGTVVTTRSDVDLIDSRLNRLFQEEATARSDGAGRLSLGGAQGMVLGNVASGMIAPGSRDAVNGGQLYATNQQVGQNRDAISGLRDELSGVEQRGPRSFMNSGEPSFNFGGSRLAGVGDGDVSSRDSKDAVNGGQLFASNARISGLEEQHSYFVVGSDEYSIKARAGIVAVAIGDSAEASLTTEGATAVGSFAKARGLNSVALGRAAHVHEGAAHGFALGTASQVEVSNGIAIGASSIVKSGASSAVAIGYASVADESNTVSVGHATYKRRIANVSAGIKNDDAATVGQLKGIASAFGGTVGVDANGNPPAPSFNVQGGNYRSVGDALSALDSSVNDTDKSVGALDSRLNRLFQEEATARTDGPGRLSLGGAHGMVLGNVANGMIAAGSRDAVNGGQLHEVRKDLQGQIDGLAERGGERVAVSGRMAAPVPMSTEVEGTRMASADAPVPTPTPTPAATEATTPEPVVKAEGENAVAVGSEGKERSVRHVAKGTADTDAVNVAQLNDVLDRATEYTDIAVEGLNKRLDGMDKRFNRMAAMSSAQSAMAMNTAGLNTYNRLGAGVGHSDGESALAVGYQRVMNERGSATFSLNGAFTNSGEKTVGVGVGIGW